MLYNLLEFFESVNKRMVKVNAFNIDDIDFLKVLDKVPHQSLLKEEWSLHGWINK